MQARGLGAHPQCQRRRLDCRNIDSKQMYHAIRAQVRRLCWLPISVHVDHGRAKAGADHDLVDGRRRTACHAGAMAGYGQHEAKQKS